MNHDARLGRVLGCVILAMAVGACDLSHLLHNDVVTVEGDNQSRTVLVPDGDELRIILGNVGPGTFDDPPTVSSPILIYRDVTVIPPFTPAGPTQQFRFTAVAHGTAIVRFQRTLDENDSTRTLQIVQDTVQIP